MNAYERMCRELLTERFSTPIPKALKTDQMRASAAAIAELLAELEVGERRESA